MSNYKFNVNNFSIEKDEKFFAYVDFIDANRIVKLLNEQEKQVQSLNEELKDYSDDNARLEEQIKELENENQRLIKMLDNVANYMQKQHKDIPLDDFVEWWNNIATEGL